MRQIIFQRDVTYDGWGYDGDFMDSIGGSYNVVGVKSAPGYSATQTQAKLSDRMRSQELLLKEIMKKCNISQSDLEDIGIVIAKIRESKINDITDEKSI